jgi:antitoxin component YwqK of YwqJK toxin-antitoxin module
MTNIRKEYKVAVSIDRETKKPVKEAWTNDQGKLERFKGPACEEFDRVSGRKIKEAHYQNGELHRDHKKGPALREWNQDGRLVLEAYYECGKLSRSGKKPAEIHYDPQSGKVIQQKFYSMGHEINSQTWRSFESHRTGNPDMFPYK